MICSGEMTLRKSIGDPAAEGDELGEEEDSGGTLGGVYMTILGDNESSEDDDDDEESGGEGWYGERFGEG